MRAPRDVEILVAMVAAQLYDPMTREDPTESLDDAVARTLNVAEVIVTEVVRRGDAGRYGVSASTQGSDQPATPAGDQ